MPGLASPISVGRTTNPSVRTSAERGGRADSTTIGSSRANGVSRERRGRVGRPGDHHQRPALGRPANELRQIRERRGTQQRGIHVVEDHGVVGEKFLAPQGKAAQRRGLLLRLLAIGVLEHRLQGNRLLPPQHVAQVPILETRRGRGQEHGDSLLSHVDGAAKLIAVVGRLLLSAARRR